MQQHALIIKSARGQRFPSDPRFLWDDSPPRGVPPFHPPYADPVPPPNLKALLRDTRGH